MFCGKCGAQMNPNEGFCGNCGTPVGTQGELDKTLGVIPSGDAEQTVSVAPGRNAAEPKKPLGEVAEVAQEVKHIWPDWQVVEKLGEGSFGKVYKAMRTEIGSAFYCAIKIIRIPQSASELDSVRSEICLSEESTTTYFKGFVDECVNEIKMMESLKGTPNIVGVEDYKVVENTQGIGWTIYIRMELLTSFVDASRDKLLAPDEVIKLGVDICNALEFCGKLNVMHRDIKPENIFVSSFGIYKLGDFGIARKLEKTTMGFSKKGTYSYMAPEIYNGSTSYDFSSDVYSLGIVLYKLLNNNRLPLLDVRSNNISYQQLQAAFEQRMQGAKLPAPCGASPALASVVLTACAHNPAQRFANATAFKTALLRVQGGATDPNVIFAGLLRPVSAPSGGAPQPKKEEPKKEVQKKEEKEPKKKMKKWKKILLSVTISLLALGIAAGVLFLSWYLSPEQKMLRALEAENFDEAVEIYEKDLEGEDADSVAEVLSERLTKLKDSYIAESRDYATTLAELDSIESMGVEDIEETLAETRDFVETLNASRTAFRTAETMLQEGDYDGAIAQYALVEQIDANYDTAMTSLQTAIDNYRSEILAKAAEYSANEQYTEAIAQINIGLSVLPNDSQLEEQLRIATVASEDKYRAESLAEAAAFAEQKLYEEAIDRLNTALAVLPGDAQLQEQLAIYTAALAEKNKAELLKKAADYAAKNDYPSAINLLAGTQGEDPEITAAYKKYYKEYEEATLAQAEAFLTDRDYDSAIALLKKATTLLKDSTALSDKLKQVEAAKPISITTLTPINGSWAWNSGNPVDPFGNDYSQACNYMIHRIDRNHTSSIEYRTYKKYSLLTGTIAPYTSMHTDGELCYKVYVDDVLVYTSPSVTRKTDAFPFEVDITGAEYIKIEILGLHDDDWEDENYGIISNVQLWPLS